MAVIKTMMNGIGHLRSKSAMTSGSPVKIEVVSRLNLGAVESSAFRLRDSSEFSLQAAAR